MIYDNIFEYGVSNGEVIIWNGFNEDIEELLIPSTIDGCPVVLIERNAFKGYKHLKEVHLPETLEAVENFAFEGCPLLRKVLCFSKDLQISHAAFRNCPKLETFDSVGEIGLGMSVFANCTRLRNIYADISAIGNKAFENCKNLQSTLIFADEVYRFHGGAFNGCDSLQSLVFNGAVDVADDLDNEMMFKLHIMCEPDCSIADLAYLGAHVDTDCGAILPF